MSASYWLEAYRGTGANSTDVISISARRSSCEIVTAVKNSPKPEQRVVPPLEVSMAWALQHLTGSSDGAGKVELAYPLTPQFRINTADPHCYTPRRNPDVEAALLALTRVDQWCQQVHSYFFDCVFSQAPDKADLDMNVINAAQVFVPVIPLLNPTHDDCASTVPTHR